MIRELRKLHLRWFHAKELKMRLILSKMGLDSSRLALIKGVCDSCRECRAREKPSNTVMPSTSLPERFNAEVECDLMFYKSKHIVFHIVDRCIRFAEGIEIPDRFMDTVIDAYCSTWMRHGPANILYSDGEGALNNDKAKAIMKHKGTELRIRARGQHATTIEARNGILRHLLHVMEEDLKRHDIPLVFTRLLHEAMFASNAFTFYNGVSPYNALYGRQPAMLPDLPVLDHEQETETSDHTREEIIRKVSLEAITQATAVAKANRAYGPRHQSLANTTTGKEIL